MESGGPGRPRFHVNNTVPPALPARNVLNVTARLAFQATPGYSGPVEFALMATSCYGSFAPAWAATLPRCCSSPPTRLRGGGVWKWHRRLLTLKAVLHCLFGSIVPGTMLQTTNPKPCKLFFAFYRIARHCLCCAIHMLRTNINARTPHLSATPICCRT